MAEPTTSRNNVHLIYGIAFVAIAVVALVALILFRSAADTSTQNASISNVAPSLTTPLLNTTSATSPSNASILTLLEGTTSTAVYVGFDVYDNNHCQEVHPNTGVWTMRFYRTNVSNGASCTASQNSCYILNETDNLFFATATNGCSNTGTADNVANVEVRIPLAYFADGTDSSGPYSGTTWTFSATVADNAGGSSSVSRTTEITWAPAIALSATNISYGTLTLGTTSSQQSVVFTNTGNTNLNENLSVDGNMSCTTLGAILLSQVRYSSTSGFTYGAADTAISTTATSGGVKLDQPTGGLQSGTMYFLINVPTGTLAIGNCTNTMTVTGVTSTPPS